MPIIVSLVPDTARLIDCTKMREEVRDALEKEGIPRTQITMEFVPCLFPERLVVRYDSRSEHLKRQGQQDREAGIVGKIIEKIFQIPVETLVVSLEKDKTGIYLTR